MKSRFARLLSASAAGALAVAATLAITPALSGPASAASFPGVGARASVSPTSQLVFDDYLGYVNSILVTGVNQNGRTVHSCWTTPLTVNLLPNYWWSYGTTVVAFTSRDCSTGRVNQTPYSLTDTPTNPPYHCQEDVSPWSDWNPGSDWHNCSIWPPPNGVWYGYAISTLVWSY